MDWHFNNLLERNFHDFLDHFFDDPLDRDFHNLFHDCLDFLFDYKGYFDYFLDDSGGPHDFLCFPMQMLVVTFGLEYFAVDLDGDLHEDPLLEFYLDGNLDEPDSLRPFGALQNGEVVWVVAGGFHQEVLQVAQLEGWVEKGLWMPARGVLGGWPLNVHDLLHRLLHHPLDVDRLRRGQDLNRNLHQVRFLGLDLNTNLTVVLLRGLNNFLGFLFRLLWDRFLLLLLGLLLCLFFCLDISMLGELLLVVLILLILNDLCLLGLDDGDIPNDLDYLFDGHFFDNFDSHDFLIWDFNDLIHDSDNLDWPLDNLLHDDFDWLFDDPLDFSDTFDELSFSGHLDDAVDVHDLELLLLHVPDSRMGASSLLLLGDDLHGYL